MARRKPTTSRNVAAALQVVLLAGQPLTSYVYPRYHLQRKLGSLSMVITLPPILHWKMVTFSC